jgi:hypothetical protein
MGRRLIGAGAPLNVLYRAFERCGHPGIKRQHANILRAIVDLADWHTGAVNASIADVADQAGYSPRRTLDLVHELADAQIITYRPGYVARGQGVRSWFLVSKRILAHLARHAVEALLPARRQRAAERRAASAERCRALGTVRRKTAGRSLRNTVTDPPPRDGVPPDPQDGTDPTRHNTEPRSEPT